MTTELVKTGFWMPKMYSERAQALAKTRGVSMRTLLVEAIALGLTSMETPSAVTDEPIAEDDDADVTKDSMASLLSNLSVIANLTTSEPKTAAPRHKPTKPEAKSWRFL